MAGEDLTLDIQGLIAARRLLAGFSPALRRDMEPRLLDVGRTIAGDIQRAIRAAPSRSNGSTRDQLASSIRVRAYGRAPDRGVLIESDGSQLPESKQPLVKSWNLSSYRHPVYGKRDRRWVTQPGIRYFSGGYVTRRQALLTQAITDAAQAAADDAEGNAT